MKKYVEQIVIAKPNWCVPAVLEMVLTHHGIKSLSQAEIAEQLDIVPAEEAIDHKKWGAQIKNNTINDFFKANSIQLHENYLPINCIQDDFFLEEEIRKLLKTNISIICGFNYTWLYGNKEDTFQHVSINVDVLQGSEILLLDPGPRDAGYKTVKIQDLFYAIKAAQDGLWCIS